MQILNPTDKSYCDAILGKINSFTPQNSNIAPNYAYSCASVTDSNETAGEATLLCLFTGIFSTKGQTIYEEPKTIGIFLKR